MVVMAEDCLHLEPVSKARIGALIHAKSNFAASPFTLLAF